jgi:arabinofuranosyltransferase
MGTQSPTISRTTALVVACALLTCSYLAIQNWGFEVDDGLIYRRYVENALTLGVFLYNKGEYYNALSSPLYSYLLLGGSYLFHSIETIEWLIATLSFFAIILLSAKIFAKQFAILPLLIFLTLLAGSSVWYRTFTLESLLFLALLLTNIYLLTRDRISPIAMVFLILARNEGVFLFLTAIRKLWREKRSFRSATTLLAGLFVGVVFGFQWWYFGAPLPATLTAKIAQGTSGYWGSPPLFLRVTYLLEWYNLTWFSPGVLLVILLMIAGLKSAWQFEGSKLLLLTVACQTLFYTALNIPSYHWYYVPHLYCVWMLITFGITVLSKHLARYGYARFVPILLGLWIAGNQLSATMRELTMERSPHIYRSIGTWLRTNTPPDAQIAAVEVGALGYYSKRYIIDIIGLVSPKNAGYLARRDMRGWLTSYSPDYILIHNPAWPQEIGAKELRHRRKLVVVESFRFEGFRLLHREKRSFSTK